MVLRRRREREQRAEVLGTVLCPSGDLVVLDFGLLRMWSGDETPLLDEWVAPPEIVEAANRAVDFEIVGPDADEVAARLDLAAVKGRYGFDLPDNRWLADRVAEACAEDDLQASVRRLPRMPHRQRVLRLLDDRPEGAEVPFHGTWAVAVRGLPTDDPLIILGRRFEPGGPNDGRWKSVWVEVLPGDPTTSEEAGQVMVEEARLMFADPSALSGWRNDEPYDGLADLAFWGRDAATVAEQVEAGVLEEDADGETVFGWADRPYDELVALGPMLDEYQEDPDLVFALDFRPHDDHYRILNQARSSSTGSGTAIVDGLDVTGFFTSWGDGAFPVFCDRLADGSLCRVRVEFATPDKVEQEENPEVTWMADTDKLAVVSARVAREGADVGWLYREDPDRDQDSGWHVFAGNESQQYVDDPANALLLTVRDLAEADPALAAILATPAPATFERSTDGTFVPVEDGA